MLGLKLIHVDKIWHRWNHKITFDFHFYISLFATGLPADNFCHFRMFLGRAAKSLSASDNIVKQIFNLQKQIRHMIHVMFKAYKIII